MRAIPVGGHFKANQHTFWSVQALFVCMSAGKKYCLKPLITSFYQTASFSTHSMTVCAHICTCLWLCAYMVLPVQTHVCVSAQVYLILCGPDSHWQLWSENECPASSPLSQMTLLTDLTVSASNHHNIAFLPLMTH